LFTTPDDAVYWAALRDWAYHTETGDRGETMLPDEWPSWSALSTTSEQCLGTKCPLYDSCFVTKARRLAAQCQVISSSTTLCSSLTCR
jgi:ATP-dependent DNA helicase DinG